MRYTREERKVLARGKEKWILRTERGEDPERVRRELKLPLKASSLLLLKHRYQRGGRKWHALLGRRHGVATKGTAAAKAFLSKAKPRHLQLTGAEPCVQVWERFEQDSLSIDSDGFAKEEVIAYPSRHEIQIRVSTCSLSVSQGRFKEE